MVADLRHYCSTILRWQLQCPVDVETTTTLQTSGSGACPTAHVESSDREYVMIQRCRCARPIAWGATLEGPRLAWFSLLDQRPPVILYANQENKIRFAFLRRLTVEDEQLEAFFRKSSEGTRQNSQLRVYLRFSVMYGPCRVYIPPRPVNLLCVTCSMTKSTCQLFLIVYDPSILAVASNLNHVCHQDDSHGRLMDVRWPIKSATA
jgi:hypothetical protein